MSPGSQNASQKPTSTLRNGVQRAPGGYRPGAGGKPDPVKSIERQLMDAQYAIKVKGADGVEREVLAELGAICVGRLVELTQCPDGAVAVRACEALMNRKFGKATERVEVFGEAKDNVFGLIDAAKAATGLRALADAINPREVVETTAEVKKPGTKRDILPDMPDTRALAKPKAVRKKR